MTKVAAEVESYFDSSDTFCQCNMLAVEQGQILRRNRVRIVTNPSATRCRLSESELNLRRWIASDYDAFSTVGQFTTDDLEHRFIAYSCK